MTIGLAPHRLRGMPAAAYVRDAELRDGHLGHAAKADDLLQSEGRDFVYAVRTISRTISQGRIYQSRVCWKSG
jgi:hypothetical protein